MKYFDIVNRRINQQFPTKFILNNKKELKKKYFKICKQIEQ